MAGENRATLNDRELRVVNYLEQMFWETGTLPSYEKASKILDEQVKYIRDCVEKKQICRKALIARGVDLEKSKSAKLLDSRQLMAANLVMNTHDTRTLREKLDFLGISSQQWHAWLRQPGFSNYMTKRAEEMFGANDYAAYQALQTNVEEGDLNAVKLHFEMRGKYKNKLEIDINIEQVVTNIVEIVAKHVRDPEVIVAIAEEIQQKALPQSASSAIESGISETVPEIEVEEVEREKVNSL